VCTSDTDCGTGKVCQAGACVAAPVPPPACTDTSGCSPGFACVSGACQCQSDTACGTGQVCDSGACRAATACSADAGCTAENRVCTAGLCVAGCTTPADCGDIPARFVCDAGHCRHTCSYDAMCPVHTICQVSGNNGVCQDAECRTTPDCAASNTICTSADHGRCRAIVPCTSDADCTYDQSCRLPDVCPPGYDCTAGHEYCIELPLCSVDSDCGTGSICDQGHCHASPPCTTTADCAGGFDCVGGGCVPFVCRGAADCTGGQACIAGTCTTPAGNVTVDHVAIVSPVGHLATGDTRQLVAVAYDAAGAAIPGAAIQWSSNAPATIAIDAATGVATGGTAAGTATLTATFGGQSASQDWELMAPAQPSKVRVTVVDQATGLPVANATVAISGGLQDTTLADGTASFTAPSAGTVDVSVFAAGYDYVSAFGLTEHDVLVALPARHDPSMATGASGGVDFQAAPGTGQVSLGLAGLSFADALPDLSIARLMGDVYIESVNFGGQTHQLPLPGAMTVSLDFGGSPFDLKSTFYATGGAGPHYAFAFAGRTDITAFSGSGGGGGAAVRLARMLPYLGQFTQALDPTVSLTEKATVADTGDVNGNGDTTELVPAWGSLPTLLLAPATPQSLRLHVVTGALPALAGQAPDTLVLLAGTRMPDSGLVPLGMSGAAVSGASAPAVDMKLAPARAGLEAGDYELLAMTMHAAGAGSTAPTATSVRVLTAARLPEDVSLDGFLPYADSTTWAPATRTIDAAPVAGASLQRVVLHGTSGDWVVYLPDPAAGSTATWTLPAAPSGMADLADGTAASVEAVGLASGLDYQGLLKLSGPSLVDLDGQVTAYSHMEK